MRSSGVTSGLGEVPEALARWAASSGSANWSIAADVLGLGTSRQVGSIHVVFGSNGRVGCHSVRDNTRAPCANSQLTSERAKRIFRRKVNYSPVCPDVRRIDHGRWVFHPDNRSDHRVPDTVFECDDSVLARFLECIAAGSSYGRQGAPSPFVLRPSIERMCTIKIPWNQVHSVPTHF